MKALFVQTAVTLIICAGIFVGLVFFMANILQKAEDKYKGTLGESVTVSGEQKQVVDFSILESNLTLSDGSKISYDYFEKLKR